MQLIQPFGLGYEFGAALLGQELEFVIAVVHSRPCFLPAPTRKVRSAIRPGIGVIPVFVTASLRASPELPQRVAEVSVDAEVVGD